MTGLVRDAQDSFDSRCTGSRRMAKDGCSVSLKGAPAPHLIVDLDMLGSPLGQSDTRCDYLFIADGDEGGDWIAPIELKSGGWQVRHVVKQLQAGAKVAEDAVPWKAKDRFRPVVAVGRAPKANLIKLKRSTNSVLFHGRPEVVRLMRCGGLLMNVLLP